MTRNVKLVSDEQMEPYKPYVSICVGARSLNLNYRRNYFPKFNDFVIFLALFGSIRYVFILRNLKIHILEVGRV